MRAHRIIAVMLAAVMPLLAGASVSTYSQTGCITKWTTKKPSTFATVTVSATKSLTVKVTVTSTPTITKTPPSTTVTAVATSTVSTTTTLSQATSTITTTSTSTETDTTTTTLTSTAFTTVTTTTVSTPITTIPTSSGFTPLASVLSSEGFAASKRKKRRSPIARADEAETPEANLLLEARATSAPLCFGGPTKYPKAVGCYRFVEVVSTSTITSTAKTTKTITAAPGTITTTSKTTVTTTITLTLVAASSTVTASASTTVTSTTTMSTTTTSTITTTSTSFAPQATFYAACDTNNLISTVNGNPITNAEAQYDFSTTTTKSAYECCVTCLLTAGCGESLYVDTGDYYSPGTCGLLNDSGTCNGANLDESLDLNDDSGLTLTASNSNCGSFYL